MMKSQEQKKIINNLAGSKRLFSHAVITPGQPGWLDEIDRYVELRPDSWKGYTIGDPLGISKWPWRLDDEKLMYPAYEKMVKAGITNFCIHKGLLIPDYKNTFHSTWSYAKVDDLGKAAKDWPQLNFIIYHSALRILGEPVEKDLAIFEKDGYISWVTDFAGIPEKYGVNNIYGDLGTTFAFSAINHPRYCAGILGTLIKGLGTEHVLWGTDSILYGSPQWQIEAFRRMEIPEELQKKMSFAPLGPADGQIKNAILGLNAAKLYKIKIVQADKKRVTPHDNLSQLKAQYEREGLQTEPVKTF